MCAKSSGATECRCGMFACTCACAVRVTRGFEIRLRTKRSERRMKCAGCANFGHSCNEQRTNFQNLSRLTPLHCAHPQASSRNCKSMACTYLPCAPLCPATWTVATTRCCLCWAWWAWRGLVPLGGGRGRPSRCREDSAEVGTHAGTCTCAGACIAFVRLCT